MKVYTLTIVIAAVPELEDTQVLEQALCDTAASFDNVISASAEITSEEDRPDPE